MAQVAIRNISKEFKTGGTSLLALDNVSCDIADGEFVCVVGHSSPLTKSSLDEVGMV